MLSPEAKKATMPKPMVLPRHRRGGVIAATGALNLDLLERA